MEDSSKSSDVTVRMTILVMILMRTQPDRRASKKTQRQMLGQENPSSRTETISSTTTRKRMASLKQKPLVEIFLK